MTKPLAGHDNKDLGAVHGTPHTADSYKSKMWPTHPTLRPQTNYKERKGSGTDVPVPPELPNPQGR